ncbi:hypothetical protein CAEBREN_04634 [Caenorhabditis brenneri]|uniref:Uncharacterized protein n=1 Tax=Caenorhabditis brenneri TaxID=135651 RepID=G0PDJ7_CAEBE|nr:hypothetical protein CAEBREN_04634 [Caenorhabditis brenneri]
MSTENGSSPMKKVIDPAAFRTQFFLLQRELRKGRNGQADCEKSWLEGHLQMLQKVINMLEEDEANGSFLRVSENYLRHLKEEHDKYDKKLKDLKSSIDSDYEKR